MAEWRYSPMHSEPWHKMNVYRQLCILATLYHAEKAPKCLWRREWVQGEPHLIWMLSSQEVFYPVRSQTPICNPSRLYPVSTVNEISFIPGHQMLTQYVSILNLTITNKVHKYIQYNHQQSPITITKCSKWIEFVFQLTYCTFKLYERYFLAILVAKIFQFKYCNNIC